MAQQKLQKAKTTTDHDAIRKWIEERDGQPARVKMSGKKPNKEGKTGGILKIDFGEPEANLEPISWEDFFEAFDHNELAFLYQEMSDGRVSRFFKFVRREESDFPVEVEEEEILDPVTEKKTEIEAVLPVGNGDDLDEDDEEDWEKIDGGSEDDEEPDAQEI